MFGPWLCHRLRHRHRDCDVRAVSKSPTQLSLERLRSEGWTAECVERWIPGANVRKDLWGFVDIVSLRDDVTMGVQTTSYSTVSARIAKIRDSELVAAVRKAGWRIVVHGWRKVGRAWTCREVDLS
jgi:hypothetical protein